LISFDKKGYDVDDFNSKFNRTDSKTSLLVLMQKALLIYNQVY